MQHRQGLKRLTQDCFALAGLLGSVWDGEDVSFEPWKERHHRHAPLLQLICRGLETHRPPAGCPHLCAKFSVHFPLVGNCTYTLEFAPGAEYRYCSNIDLGAPPDITRCRCFQGMTPLPLGTGDASRHPELGRPGESTPLFPPHTAEPPPCLGTGACILCNNRVGCPTLAGCQTMLPLTRTVPTDVAICTRGE